MLIGSMAEAEADLCRALEGVGDTAPALRLQTAMGLAQVLSSGDRLTEGVALLDAELSRAAAVDDDLRARAETVLLNAARMDAAANATAAPRADRLRRLVLDGGDATPEQLAAVAASEAQAGISAQRTAEIGIRALEQMSARPDLDTLSYGHAARALIAADRLDEATAALDRGLEISRRRGVRFTAVFLVAILAEARYRAGALADAERLMREALASDAQWGIGRPAMLSVLIQALLDQGRTEAAGELAAGMMLDATTAAPAHRYPRIMGLQARGRWRLAAGDAAGALLDYERCQTGLVACAEPNPALVEWRSDAAWALLALGNHDRSRALADKELALARNYGAARPIGIALRARAAAGSPTERIALLREAVVTLDRSPARLVRAQVLIDLGLALERGPEARERLTAALELADACGAQPLVRRARRALSRTGARPRRTARSGPASLTAAERRVADLAAAGLTNPAIAARLVVTVRTVELHLTNTYRKLGITSRAALTRALSSQAEYPRP
jgi:DNA-binding CsgD family transcriptional regulator